MLPGHDGFELCRDSGGWQAGSVPVVFLTARSDEVDRVLGLEIGGDDYMTKPFSPRELVARVKAHLRRRKRNAAPKRPSQSGPFRLDQAARRVFQNDKEVELTSTEFKLLEFFSLTPATPFRANSCCGRSGASSISSRRGRWTCMSAGCASKSK